MRPAADVRTLLTTSCTRRGNTALHIAVQEFVGPEAIEYITALLDAGADSNAADYWGKTPLDCAEGLNRPQACIELLERSKKRRRTDDTPPESDQESRNAWPRSNPSNCNISGTGDCVHSIGSGCGSVRVSWNSAPAPGRCSARANTDAAHNHADGAGSQTAPAPSASASTPASNAAAAAMSGARRKASGALQTGTTALLLPLALLSLASAASAANLPLAAAGRFCGSSVNNVDSTVTSFPHTTAAIDATTGMVHLFQSSRPPRHGDGAADDPPLPHVRAPKLVGEFNATDLVIGLLVASVAADVDGDGVDELVLASATGDGKWDADAVQALAVSPDCKTAKVKATSGTVGIGMWEALAPLQPARPGGTTAVLAIQANAPNASFVIFGFSPPYYMDVLEQSDYGMPDAGKAISDYGTATRLAWAASAFDLQLLLTPAA